MPVAAPLVLELHRRRWRVSEGGRRKRICRLFREYTAVDGRSLPMLLRRSHRSSGEEDEPCGRGARFDFAEHSTYPFIERFKSLKEAIAKFVRI